MIIPTDEGNIEYFPTGLPSSLVDRMLDSLHESDWEPALLNVGNGNQIYAPETRKCERIMRIDHDLADEVWKIVKKWIPDGTMYGTPVGLNPMFRFLRYDPGDYFHQHFDGTYEAEDGTVSRITVQMYLNEDFEGGETRFYEYDDDIVCGSVYTHRPRTGDIVLFDQRILHEGMPVTKGRKVCVRTEIMFRKECPTLVL